MLVRSLVAMIFSAVLCAAATAGSVERCHSEDPGVAIRACTALIKAGDSHVDFLGTHYGFRALAYFRDGQYAKAIPDIFSAMTRTNDVNQRAILLRLRAQAYFHLNDYPHAITDYTELMRLHPADHRSYNDRAYLYLKTKNYPAAIVDYSVALDKEPNIAQALFGRGLAKRANGDIAGASNDMARAKAIEGDIADSFADIDAATR